MGINEIGNNIGESGAKMISGALKTNTTLTQLNLECDEKESGKKLTNITVAVQRPFKNADNLYDTDFIRCILWNSVASNTTEYCHSGDVIGVKGRLQSSKYEDKDKVIHYNLDVIAERVTFLSTFKKHDNENGEDKGREENEAGE